MIEASRGVRQFAWLVVTLVIAWGARASSLAQVGWETYAGDPGSAHYSALTQINRATVDLLRPAWSWETGETAKPEFGTSPGLFEATPLVVEGVMYLTTPYNQIVALDARSGAERWRFEIGRAHV